MNCLKYSYEYIDVYGDIDSFQIKYGLSEEDKEEIIKEFKSAKRLVSLLIDYLKKKKYSRLIGKVTSANFDYALVIELAYTYGRDNREIELYTNLGKDKIVNYKSQFKENNTVAITFVENNMNYDKTCASLNLPVGVVKRVVNASRTQINKLRGTAIKDTNIQKELNTDISKYVVEDYLNFELTKNSIKDKYKIDDAKLRKIISLNKEYIDKYNLDREDEIFNLYANCDLNKRKFCSIYKIDTNILKVILTSDKFRQRVIKLAIDDYKRRVKLPDIANRYYIEIDELKEIVKDVVRDIPYDENKRNIKNLTYNKITEEKRKSLVSEKIWNSTPLNIKIDMLMKHNNGTSLRTLSKDYNMSIEDIEHILKYFDTLSRERYIKAISSYVIELYKCGIDKKEIASIFKLYNRELTKIIETVNSANKLTNIKCDDYVKRLLKQNEPIESIMEKTHYSKSHILKIEKDLWMHSSMVNTMAVDKRVNILIDYNRGVKISELAEHYQISEAAVSGVISWFNRLSKEHYVRIIKPYINKLYRLGNNWNSLSTAFRLDDKTMTKIVMR